MGIYYESEGSLDYCRICSNCREYGYDGCYRDEEYIICDTYCNNYPNPDCFKCKTCEYYKLCLMEYNHEKKCMY